MEIRLSSTDKLVILQTDSGEVPARIWEGHVDGSPGVPIHAFITRIAVPRTAPAEAHEQFDRELHDTQHAQASPEIQAAYPGAVNLHVTMSGVQRVEGREPINGVPAWLSNIVDAISLADTQGKGIGVVGLADLKLALQVIEQLIRLTTVGVEMGWNQDDLAHAAALVNARPPLEEDSQR